MLLLSQILVIGPCWTTTTSTSHVAYPTNPLFSFLKQVPKSTHQAKSSMTSLAMDCLQNPRHRPMIQTPRSHLSMNCLRTHLGSCFLLQNPDPILPNQHHHHLKSQLKEMMAVVKLQRSQWSTRLSNLDWFLGSGTFRTLCSTSTRRRYWISFHFHGFLLRFSSSLGLFGCWFYGLSSFNLAPKSQNHSSLPFLDLHCSTQLVTFRHVFHSLRLLFLSPMSSNHPNLSFLSCFRRFSATLTL